MEDNSVDVHITTKAFEEDKVQHTINVVKDGVEAFAFLRC